jgi:uncharacterized protein (DUF924 family)
MTAEDVLDFWFSAEPDRFRESPWFTQDEAFDALVTERFSLTLEAARDGVLDPWSATAHGALALVIVLDQFSRNIHRGSYLAFAGDARARRIARTAVVQRAGAALTPVQRVFLYLPFEHSETMDDQNLSVTLHEGLRHRADLTETIDYAHRHRDVIRRFGRFPHRNAALGRTSTPEELAYVAEGNTF